MRWKWNDGYSSAIHKATSENCYKCKQTNTIDKWVVGTWLSCYRNENNRRFGDYFFGRNQAPWRREMVSVACKVHKFSLAPRKYFVVLRHPTNFNEHKLALRDSTASFYRNIFETFSIIIFIEANFTNLYVVKHWAAVIYGVYSEYPVWFRSLMKISPHSNWSINYSLTEWNWQHSNFNQINATTK